MWQITHRFDSVALDGVACIESLLCGAVGSTREYEHAAD